MAYNRNGRGAQRQGNYRSNNNGRRGTFRDVLREKNKEAFDVASFIRNSATLRRHVGLAIVAQVKADGMAGADDRVFVKFGLTKYTVKVNNMGVDYPYTHKHLLRALMSSTITTREEVYRLLNNLTVQEFNEPLKECDTVSSEDSVKDIENLAEAVLAHINEQVVED